jgi:hypothetical protein
MRMKRKMKSPSKVYKPKGLDLNEVHLQFLVKDDRVERLGGGEILDAVPDRIEVNRTVMVMDRKVSSSDGLILIVSYSRPESLEGIREERK